MRYCKKTLLSLHLCCGPIFILLVPGLRGQSQDQATLAFKSLESTSIVARLEEYESKEYSRSIRYKASCNLVANTIPEPIHKLYDVSSSNGRRLVGRIDSKTGSTHTYARSEFGQFSVTQGPKESGGESKLNYFDAGQDHKKALDFEKQGFGKLLPALLPLSGLSGASWSDFFKKIVGLRFSNYREQPNGNIELDFKSDLFVGSITLFDARNPVIIKSIRTRSTANMVTTTERKLLPLDASDPMPRCISYEEVLRNTVDGSVLLSCKCEFTDYSIDEVSDKQFKLSNYQLPDPEGVPAYSKRSYRWVWLTSAAIVLFSISLLLRWMVRRRASVA